MRLLITIIIFFTSSINAEFKLKVCSQNCHRLTDNAQHEAQLISIFKRIYHNDCDVVALQESSGASLEVENLLKKIKTLLNQNSFSNYEYLYWKQTSNLQLAALYKKEKFINAKVIPLKNNIINNFNLLDRPKHVSRNPFIFELLSKSNYKFLFANIHFKSKTFAGRKDYTGFSHELERMQSTAQVRDLLSQNNAEIKLVIGDRNSLPSSGSASILRGESSLLDYVNLNCVLSKLGNSFCRKAKVPDFYSLLYDSGKITGTLIYKKKIQAIDDILIHTKINFIYNSRVEKRFSKASDHYMPISDIKFEIDEVA